MLVNFYGVSRLLLSIWGIGMVCEGLYTCMGNSVVPPQNPAGVGRKMKHNFLGFAPLFPVFKRSRSDGISLILCNILRCSDKNKHKLYLGRSTSLWWVVGHASRGLLRACPNLSPSVWAIQMWRQLFSYTISLLTPSTASADAVSGSEPPAIQS